MEKIELNGSRGQRVKVLEITVVCLFFLVLSLIDTYPLVNHLNKGMPYFPYPERGHEISYMVHGDYLQLYYNLWLFKDALLGNIPFFTNPYEFSVGEGYMPSFNSQFFPMSLFFAIFSVFGDITAYNMLVILSYILAGISGYLLVKLYTKSRTAALLAGIILALFPYRTGELLGGHPNGFLFFLIPLTIYLIERSFRNNSVLASLGAGLCVISMSLLEGHFHYYTFLFLAIFLPWRFFFDLYGRSEEIKLLKEIRIKDAVLVFFSGTAAGLSLILIKSNPPILEDPIFYSSIILPFILIGFWVLYSRLFSLATKIPLKQVLREDASNYLPLFLFLLYLIRLVYPIKHLGKGIAIIALCCVIALKGYRLFSVRGLLRERILEALPFLKIRLFKTILPFLLMCSLTVVWALYTRSHLETSIASEGRPITQIMKYSPEISDFFKRHNRSVEKNIYLGLVPFSLAFIILFRRRVEGRKNILFFGAFFIVSFILSFGPNLRPYIHLYNILYDHLPFFNYPRVAGRMITITAVMMVILSGYGVKWLVTSSPLSIPLPQGERIGVRGRYLLIGSIFIVTLLDFFPFSSRGISIPSKGNSVYEEIKRERGDKKALEIPIWPGDSAWSSIYQYYVTIYRYHMINGYDPGVSKKYIEQVFERLYPLNFGELREKEYRFLKELNVKYIVMHEEEFPRKVSPFPFRSSLDNMKRSPFIKYIKKDGPIYLFEVNEGSESFKIPSFSISSPIGGLYQAEALPRLTGSVVKDEDASGGQAALGRNGEREGWLLYGPYRNYPSGNYKAIFRMKINKKDNEEKVVANIDVATGVAKGSLNKKIITTRDFRGSGYQDFVLPFTLSFPQVLEFRVYHNGLVDLWVDYTYVLVTDENDPRWNYRGEDLFRLPDRFEGPTRRYTAGEYVAIFYIKAEENDLKEIAHIQILTENEMISEKGLQKEDFPEKGRYFPFYMRFRLLRESFIDFKVSSRDLTKIDLDRIDIVKEKG